MEGDRLRPDALAAREVAADVVDDLVAVDGRVRVRAGDRLGVEVGHARHERADRAPRAPRTSRGSSAAGGRDPSSAGRRGSGRRTARRCRPSRRRRTGTRRGRAGRTRSPFLTRIRAVPAAGPGRRDARSRGACTGRPSGAGRRGSGTASGCEGRRAARSDSGEGLRDPPAVDDAPRDEDVVAASTCEVAEGRLERGAAREEKKVVPVAVREPAFRLRLAGKLEEGDDTSALKRRACSPRAPSRREGAGAGAAGRAPYARRLPVPAARLRRADRAVGHRRPLVVEDRELAVESAPREALLVAERARGDAERGVGLGGQLARRHPVDHLSRRPRGRSGRPAASPRSTRRGRGSSRSRSPCRPRAG